MIFNKFNSFRVHIRSRHQDKMDLPKQSSKKCRRSEDIRDVQQNSHQNITVDTAAADCHAPENMDQTSKNMYSGENEIVHQFNLFIVKLLVKHMVSEIVIDEVINAFNNFHTVSNDRLLEQTIRIATDKNKDFKGEEDIIRLFKNDPFNYAFNATYGCLRSKHKRMEYIKRNMKFVECNEIALSSLEDAVYHYIPLEKSLRNLMSDKTLKSQFISGDGETNKKGVFSDFHDGSVYKTTTNEKMLQLILYQDSFEVVNPLGSAKSTHKLLGVYYTLANLKPHNRSNVDSYQLLMLIKDSVLKTYKSEIIFKPLIDELQELYNVGFDLGFANKTKGRLLVILGDNLGSHSIGGYAESFSVRNFCRYCTISQEEVQAGAIVSNARNPTNYDEDAKKATEAQCIVNGVKFKSPFNSLSYFHVATPALPPCIAHDVYEGVLSYDVVAFLKYFCIKKKWITQERMNNLIFNFKYKSYDALDKPVKINFKSEKLSGHAIENLVLLRNLNLIMAPHVDDYDDEIWQLMLKLREIVSYIAAPSIAEEQVSNLQVLIVEYFEDLRKYLPEHKLRPKHHYMTHYPGLIKAFGPLSKSSTLRMEAKHQFFKRCIQRSGNYKNIGKHAANKHSLLQAYSLEGSLFQEGLSHEKATILCKNNFSDLVQYAIGRQFGSIEDKLYTVSEIKCEGVTYKKEHFVVKSVYSYKVIFGRIVGIILHENLIHLILEEYDGKIDPRVGCYLLEQVGRCQVTPLNSLADRMCMPLYEVFGKPCINLKYAFVEH